MSSRSCCSTSACRKWMASRPRGSIHEHPRFERTPIIFVTGVHITRARPAQGLQGRRGRLRVRSRWCRRFCAARSRCWSSCIASAAELRDPESQPGRSERAPGNGQYRAAGGKDPGSWRRSTGPCSRPTRNSSAPTSHCKPRWRHGRGPRTHCGRRIVTRTSFWRCCP